METLNILSPLTDALVQSSTKETLEILVNYYILISLIVGGYTVTKWVVFAMESIFGFVKKVFNGA